MYNYLSFNTNNNDTEFTYNLKKLLHERFMLETFLFNYTMFDYSTVNNYNNFNINGYSEYKIRTNLNEINEFTQLFEWLKYFFFDELNFYMRPNQNKKNFLSKFPV